MTNSEIIRKHRMSLMEQGLIGTTGRTLEAINEKGETVTLQEPEEIHTYTAWKELGYQVQKGQKAVAKFLIWKRKVKTDDETGKSEAKMFMTRAAFFTRGQVQAISA